MTKRSKTEPGKGNCSSVYSSVKSPPAAIKCYLWSHREALRSRSDLTSTQHCYDNNREAGVMHRGRRVPSDLTVDHLLMKRVCLPYLVSRFPFISAHPVSNFNILLWTWLINCAMCSSRHDVCPFIVVYSISKRQHCFIHTKYTIDMIVYTNNITFPRKLKVSLTVNRMSVIPDRQY